MITLAAPIIIIWVTFITINHDLANCEAMKLGMVSWDELALSVPHSAWQ